MELEDNSLETPERPVVASTPGTTYAGSGFDSTVTSIDYLSAQGFGSNVVTYTLRATETTGGAGDVPASIDTGALVSMPILTIS